jgi:hypothetical protein
VLGALLIALVLMSASACAGEGLAKDAAEQTHDVGGLAHSRWTPPKVGRLPIGQLPTRVAIDQRSARLAEDLDGLSTDDAFEVVDAVCEVLELQDVQEDPSKAPAYLEQKLGGPLGSRAEVQGFLQDMGAADSSLDQAEALGKAALCKAASEHD